ncbi:MAG TPA: regulatory protein RecX [Thermoanaerobaculia bacterium]|nr:regulatory protein RecX [Thermoanaerobaculia bacterium]
MSDCYIAALRILNYRFNSEAELRRKLARKKFEAAEIDKTIAQLHDEKWLDDERFAGALVRTRANKRLGRKRILRELQAAGVHGETAGKAVEENLDGEREAEALRELAQKRARVLARRLGPDFLSTSEGRNKLAVYLLNQGYDAALVYEAVKEIRVAHHQPDS